MRLILIPIGLLIAVGCATPAKAPAFVEDGYNPNHRLIGLGCGPKRLTFTADEEDHFPAPCYVIGTPQELCPDDPDWPPEPVDAKECAEYLGRQGW